MILLNTTQIDDIWLWILQNYKIKCEERSGEILATANQIFSNIEKYQIEQFEHDLLPQATLLSCLVVSELFYLKSCSFPAVRKASKVIEFNRHNAAINYYLMVLSAPSPAGVE